MSTPYPQRPGTKGRQDNAHAMLGRQLRLLRESHLGGKRGRFPGSPHRCARGIPYVDGPISAASRGAARAPVRSLDD